VALVCEFQHAPSEKNSLHNPVLCGWRVFDTGETKILQLDTYGSEHRQIPNKVSQSIQLNREGATVLVSLIRDAFPGIRLE
jgi:hypothetical protein